MIIQPQMSINGRGNMSKYEQNKAK